MGSRRITGIAVARASLLVMALAVSACGQSSAPPTPTPRPRVVTLKTVPLDRRAVAAARAFLRAFKRGDKSTMLRLMSPRLLRRNRHQYVAQMLGAQNAPIGVAIDGAHTYRAKRGTWTRILARLNFDHGVITDRLAIVRTPAGYRVDSIRFVRASGS